MPEREFNYEKIRAPRDVSKLKQENRTGLYNHLKQRMGEKQLHEEMQAHGIFTEGVAEWLNGPENASPALSQRISQALGEIKADLAKTKLVQRKNPKKEESKPLDAPLAEAETRLRAAYEENN